MVGGHAFEMFVDGVVWGKTISCCACNRVSVFTCRNHVSCCAPVEIMPCGCGETAPAVLLSECHTTTAAGK
jgi:hypothetical protein